MQESITTLETPKSKFDFKKVLQYLLAKGISTQEWLGRKQIETKFMPHWQLLKNWLTQFSGEHLGKFNERTVLSYLEI
jgi:hypothetical protein